MEYMVVLEKERGHYRAVVPALPGCVVKGKTRADTLAQMQQAIAEWLKKIEITTVEVNAPPFPDAWAPFIGMWKDDPTWDDFQAEIANYRRQIEKEGDDG